MKALCLFGFLLLLIPAFTTAQNLGSNTSKQEVLDAQSARITAMLNADLGKLDELLTEDLSYAHTNGWTETKSGYLETIRSGKIDYVSFVPKVVEVRVYDDSAVLTGKVDVNLGRTDFSIRFLEVQRKVDGVWKLTAWQSVLNKVD
ncbi:uncharacterized protein DUF4440 [Christiangramia gaetbulicola]|uniref:Uncharacterized protein DUF4440 n=1 Tax=Christiangramia gaetbulicola TaxID=703340 RepID=A0A2T6AI48_9FLAO|nr:nuclear transport factor 2 family protein [Christiangramia gaetbulicola]PTX43490.1 uncharacterized protein DUF4440 [Christiangramia gaetbulicola]